LIRFFYNVFVVPVLWAGFRLLAIRDEKARLILFRQGTIFSDLEKKLNEFPLKKKRVLFHVSSVGEYLQARPLILKLKEKLTDTAFILSFLSPSLEGQLERNRAADIETYLPLDTPGSVRRFLELLRPDLIVFSTYDVWPNLLWQAKERGIPALLVNASLAENSGRLNPAARWFFRSVYKGLSAVGAISEHDGKR
jgi:3-deoxy-D-manno-octulosonic-acid transferase